MRLSRVPWLELALLGALLLQFGGGLAWIAHTWRDATYESSGLLAALLLVPALLRPPPRRAAPSRPHLAGVLAVALADLALAPLQLRVASAALGLLGLHLWAFAFRAYQGTWYGARQLWLGLLALPVVFWANVLLGYPLQHLVTRAAAAALGLYGLQVQASGTLLQLPGAALAVDASCSGVKLLYAGLLLGLLAAPLAPTRAARALFWSALVGLLLAVNVMRVISLAMAQLQLGRPLGPQAHEAVGILAFALAAALALLLLRRLGGRRPAAPPATAPPGLPPRAGLRPALAGGLALALAGCALLRQLAPATGEPRDPGDGPRLPATLAGEAGRSEALEPSERLLAARPGVALERRRYGASQVALLTTRGLRELHPPSVCLRASGREVVARAEEQGPRGCLGRLRLRRGEQLEHFYYAYFDGARTTCSFWRRAALASWQQLTGAPAAWSTVQVMDRDPLRARRLLEAALTALVPEAQPAGPQHPELRAALAPRRP